MEIIDFHTQVLPYDISSLIPRRGRSWAKLALNPISHAFHESYPFLRFLPSVGRQVIEGMADRVLPAPFLFLESSAEDLKQAMAQSSVSTAVVVADPPRISNAFVLELASRNPALIPAVQIERADPTPAETLLNLHNQGARILKISSPQLGGMVEEAARLKMPVILKITKLSALRGILEKSAGTPVILAHMNLNDSDHTFEIAESFPNVYLETSWQPVEVIGEAVRRLGAERVIFGSDWPWMGNNMQIALKRIREAVQAQIITEADSAQILSGNALRILRTS